MPGWFIISIIFTVITGLVFLGRSKSPRPVEGLTMSVNADRTKQRQALLGVGLVCAALTVLFLLVASYNPVGTKEEGIKTSFGATKGSLSNGFHMTWPWYKVHEMDAAIQTDNFLGKKCIAVRIANQQEGCAHLSFQWRIQPGAAPELYKDYRSFEHVRDALVTRRLGEAANETLGNFNPLNTIVNGTNSQTPANGTTKGAVSKPFLVRTGNRISFLMNKSVGKRIEVLNTIVKLVTFDKDTQSRINQLQQQVALTRIASQKYQTNTKTAAANKALQAKGLSELVLVSHCLDTLDTLVKAGQAVPAGFSCWPGGSGTPVIAAPTTK